MNSDASGLIDIRALSEASRKEASVARRPETWDAESVDELLGIGTGAPIGAPLVSPMLGPAASPRHDRSVTLAITALIALVVVAAATVAIVAMQVRDRPTAAEEVAGAGPIAASLEPATPEHPVEEPSAATTAEAGTAPLVEAPTEVVDTPAPPRRRARRRGPRAARGPEAPAPVAPAPPRGDRTLEELLDRALRP